LTSLDLRRLHAVLTGRAAAGPSPWRTAGHYHREAFDRHGHATGRVFSALPAHLLQEKVDELLTWMEFELHAGERHPVLVIGTFILGLHAASPFDSANSRLARVLITLLLERAGYAYVPYSSIEAQIEELRNEYHESYDLSQTHLWKGECDLGPWLAFFLDVLSRQRERVEVKLALEREASAFPPLQLAILDTVREHGTVDAGLLLRATGANRNTLKDNLRKLVDRGALEKSGERRGTRYRLAVLDEVRR
jgi:Fic family protein